MEGRPAVFLQSCIAFLLIALQPFVARLPADLITPTQFRQAYLLTVPFLNEPFLFVQGLPLSPGQTLSPLPLLRKLRLSLEVSTMSPVQNVNYVAGPEQASDVTAPSRQLKS